MFTLLFQTWPWRTTSPIHFLYISTMDDRRHQLVEAVDIEVEDAVEVQEVDPPSRTRGPPNLETSEDIQTERRGVNADLHHSREHNRGRGRGGDRRGRRGTGSSVDRRPRNESKSRQS